MYDHIGSKIKVLACISGWIFLIAGVITWFVFIVNDSPYDDFIGWICLPAGVLSFIGSWVLYGFGEHIEDTKALYNLTYDTTHPRKEKQKPIFSDSTSEY